ncbi:unnamed protein product [Toxocara canis]|uniref:Rav1p_C domain-containing protein n=1 Tax=Toxocara canis TaxID=6265 RepID=A0A183UYL1_TOXCA|nr:unnamed protein product [Toxocara canis]
MVPIREMSRRQLKQATEAQVRPIQISDFESALMAIKPSTNQEMRRKLRHFAEVSGQVVVETRTAKMVVWMLVEKANLRKAVEEITVCMAELRPYEQLNMVHQKLLIKLAVFMIRNDPPSRSRPHPARSKGAPGTGMMCVTLFGRVHWLDEKSTSNLCELIDEELDEGASTELVASDCAAHPDRDILAFLATWLLEILCESLTVSGCKFSLKNPPTFTRLTAETAIANNRHCWLIFTSSRAARLFLVEPSSVTVEEVDSIGDIYPGLDLGDLPGSAVRTKLKFSGAISVLQLLRLEGREDKILVLISSTLGPAAVWSLAMSADKSHFEWKRLSVLDETRGHDTIVCSTANQYFIAIAAYDGLILIYRREELLSEELVIRACSLFEHPAPAISMKFLDQDQLAVLSTSGVHLLTALHTPTSSVFTDDESRNTAAINT